MPVAESAQKLQRLIAALRRIVTRLRHLDATGSHVARRHHINNVDVAQGRQTLIELALGRRASDFPDTFQLAVPHPSLLAVCPLQRRRQFAFASRGASKWKASTT